MKLTFLGKDSTPNDSPTLYATDRDTYLVQGYTVTDPEALAQMPGNDLWSFDGEMVVFTHLSGDGAIQGYELTREPALVTQCVTAFEAAWRAAIPHSQYTPS